MDLKKGDKNEPSSFLDKLGFQKRKVKEAHHCLVYFLRER